MATLSDKETNIRAVLGETTATFWTSAQLQRWYLDAQKLLVDRLPPDAFRGLYRLKSQVFDGTVNTFNAPTTDIILGRVTLKVQESDGYYSEAWQLVAPETLDEMMAIEGVLAHDSTETRIFCINNRLADGLFVDPTTDVGFLLYPTPASNRTGQMKFMVRPTESGILTLPSNLQTIAEYYAISMAASKKSRDLDMANRYKAMFENEIARIEKHYAGMFGLNSEPNFQIMDVVGYD